VNQLQSLKAWWPRWQCFAFGVRPSYGGHKCPSPPRHRRIAMITPSIAGGVPEANPSTKTHGAINRGIFNQILLG
jgi:hypothetical protein